jgi:hypothetical protein
MAVIIGMDPHKRSATIEVIDDRGDKIGSGKFGTDQAGYAEMLEAGRRFTDRVWAVEGCNGVGRHIAHRLVHDGETVLDVPAKLSAQVRVFATGNGRKTDPVDAHSVALAALHAPNLVRVQVDPELVVMGMLVDRRDELGRARTQTVNRLHRLLLAEAAGAPADRPPGCCGTAHHRPDSVPHPGAVAAGRPARGDHPASGRRDRTEQPARPLRRSSGTARVVTTSIPSGLVLATRGSTEAGGGISGRRRSRDR